VKELFRKTLSASVSWRYHSAEDLIDALDDLIEESNPKRRHLNSTYSPSRNYFVGRSAEISQIHSAFMSGKRTVFLCGMGGIGKTELALQYAKQYESHYDVIAFGRFNDSLDNLFKSPEFISIENNTEGSLNLNSVRGLVDERTLLIVDNFDEKSDIKLDAVLSLMCNLLFTSRFSFEQINSSDSAVAHLTVGELAQNEQTALFERECGRTLSDDERRTVQLIVQKIHGYTLLIPLIAKTNRNDVYSLTDIHQRITDAGIKGASGVSLSHHKDSTVSTGMSCLIVTP